MPRRKLPLVLSPKAKEDYQDILLESLTNWGERHADRYEAALDRALERIETYPEIGRRRDELAPGLRSWPVEQHLILYRIEAKAIWVTRIVHGRRDLASALRER